MIRFSSVYGIIIAKSRSEMNLINWIYRLYQSASQKERGFTPDV